MNPLMALELWLAALAVAFVPAVLVGAWARWARRRDARRSPLVGELQQLPGEGHALQFPGWSETRPLDQARAESRWLAEHLYRKTGERVQVDPVLALPGWYVTQSVPSSDIRVINPNMHRFMADCKGSPMPEPQRRRVMTAIEECYTTA